MGRGFVSSYRNLLSAHSILFSLLATANFIGFLQPPKGWVDEATAGGDMAAARAKSVMYKTSSLEAFSITNSLSLYCSVSGLLYYIYCTNVSVLSMTAVEGLTERNYYDDPREPNYILTNMRAYLRCVVLPMIRRRATIISWFLASSLVLSLMAFFSSGYAATAPDERMYYLILPGIPGCGLVLAFLALLYLKQWRELNYDRQFDDYWIYIAQFKADEIPPIPMLSYESRCKLDPSSILLRACSKTETGKKHPSHKHCHSLSSQRSGSFE